MAANGLMAQQRTCTSYQEPFDESTACNLEERLACITKLLNIKTSGNAKRFIDDAFDALKSKYSDAQLRDMVKQRKARVKRLTRPSDAITFAHRTAMCIDPKCVDAHEDFTFVDVLTDGRDAPTSNAILSLAKRRLRRSAWGSLRSSNHMGFVNWVSSTGSTVRVFSQASHSPRLSRLPISKQRGERSVRETSVPEGDHA